MIRKHLVVIGVGSLLLLLLAEGAFLYFGIGAAFDITYAPFQHSSSIEGAKQAHIFVSQPALEQQTVNLNGFTYHIQEVWVEQATRVEYEWIFIRRRIPTGYRLMATLTVPADSLEGKNLLGLSPDLPLVANDKIELSTITPSARKDTWLFFGRLNEPFPNNVTLAFKKRVAAHF
jgi:hypothetical protein